MVESPEGRAVHGGKRNVTVWEYIFRWETVWWLMIALYVPVCIGLITIVLLQKGKGVGFSGAFGVGAGTDAVFGPRGSVSLPVRLTHILAGVFMVLALLMSLVAGRLGMGVAPERLDEELAAEEAVTEDIDDEDAFGGLDLDDIDDATAPGLLDFDQVDPMDAEPADIDDTESPGDDGADEDQDVEDANDEEEEDGQG